jgi:hypothetical protein
MRNVILAAATAIVLASSGAVAPVALADEPGVARKAKSAKKCVGPKCGPYAACGARCRVACPDGYSCNPLYGAYGPYGGVGYWGGYTLTGWGRW